MSLLSVNDIRRTSREAKRERLQMNAQVEKLPRGLHDLTGMHPELFSRWQKFRLDCLSLRNQQMGTESDKNRDGFVTIIVGPDEFHRTDLDLLLLPRDPKTGDYVMPIRVAERVGERVGTRVANAPGVVLKGKGTKGSAESDKGAVGAVLDYLGFLGGLRRRTTVTVEKSRGEQKTMDLSGEAKSSFAPCPNCPYHMDVNVGVCTKCGYVVEKSDANDKRTDEQS